MRAITTRSSILPFLTVTVLACSVEARAQGLDVVERSVKPGDTIIVTDRLGRETRAVFSGATSNTLTFIAGGNQQQLTAADIGRVEIGDSLWNGSIVGAAAGAWMGLGAAGASCSPHCAREMTSAAATIGLIGAAVGALADRAIAGRRVLWGVAPNSSHSLRPRQPVTSLGDLWQRARSSDTIVVVDRHGRMFKGSFESASAASIGVVEGGTLREISGCDVQVVTRRGNRKRAGALIGAMLGVFTGAAAARDTRGSSPVAGAVFGAGLYSAWGSGVGALVTRNVPIYRSATSTAGGACTARPAN